MPSDRPNEKAARHIVSTVLDVPVERFDDGSADSKVDALIQLPEGPVPLEITSDHDVAFNRLWAALEKVGHQVVVPGLRHSWLLWLGHETQVNKLLRRLPDMLREREQASEAPGSLSESMRAAGIRRASTLDGPQGKVRLLADGWAGFATGTPDEWVTAVLEAAPDNARKLAAHSAAKERHVFVWATAGSSFGVQLDFLENRDGASLPERAPALPEPITHVWIAGSFSSQGCIRWSQATGWQRVWEWTEGIDLRS